MMKQKVTHMLRSCAGKVRTFRRSEDGTATIELALLFPLYMAFLGSSIEMGTLMTRQAMLDRGLDVAIRSVRIGTMSPVTHDALRDEICERAGIIPDCANQLKVEMYHVDLLNWQDVPTQPDCIDRIDPVAGAQPEPLSNFEKGGANEMTVVRACALFDPLFPNLGMGKRIPRESGDAYGLVSTTAFVVEPL